jgi:hypothetical protein
MTTRTVVVAIAWLAAVIGAAMLVVTAGTMPGIAASGMSPVLAGLSLAIVTDASVGAVLTVKRPGNVVGLALLTAAILLAVTFLGFAAGGVLTEQRGRHDIVAGLVSLIGVVGIYPTIIVAGPLIALLFPNGQLPGPRWRWPVAVIAATVAVGTVSVVLRPGPIGSLADNPLGVGGFTGSEPVWGLGESLAAAGLPFALMLAFAAVILRIRRSEGIERAQLKWFVAANVAFITLMTIAMFDGATGPSVFDILAPWALSLPPIAVGVAILRYRLFEIDRIISRTLSWAVVTGSLGVVFAGTVVGLQAQSANVTGSNTLAVAASTLVVAALFQPFRRRVQDAVDRRFNRATYDADQTVARFSARLREEMDIATVTADLHGTVLGAVNPASLGLWIREAKP